MVLGNLFRRNSCQAQARALYEAVVAQARRPEFYTHCGVPDTLDGRFDLVALHAFLLLHRLKRDHPASAELGQSVFDTMFLDMDQSLRELGAGDLGVGRKVKRMAQGLYGRIAAYEAGLEGADAELEAALRRNLYGTAAPQAACVEAVAAYMRREAAALGRRSYAALAAGRLSFGAPPRPRDGK
ncbi:MAG: ubiquinol-cytochrome C chaperone family protein [Kiloniellaceae bacterium]